MMSNTLRPQAYTTHNESPAIISMELAGVTSAAWDDTPDDGGDSHDDDEDKPLTTFRVRTSLVLRETVAQLTVEDEAMLELALQLPPCWPLKPATVEPRRKVGQRAAGNQLADFTYCSPEALTLQSWDAFRVSCAAGY